MGNNIPDSVDHSGYALPYTERIIFADPSAEEGHQVEFRLFYRGRLPAQAHGGSSRSKEKHAIRRVFHRQLSELWKQHYFLKSSAEVHDKASPLRYVDNIAFDYRRCEYRFVPLLTKSNGLACSLDILFLRRDDPGSVIRSGGDLDNRLKVLFDALKIPDTCNGIDAPRQDEDPFFCLLEDDSLVNDVSITTDRLLTPLQDNEHVHEVLLILHVKTKIAALEAAIPGLWHLSST